MANHKPFVHLHCHTDYSLLDGCAPIKRYMERCNELNMPALAMTDHGNLFGAMDFYQKAKAAGVKPLVGCEIYLVHDHKQSEKPKRDRKRSDDINDIPAEQLKPHDFPRNQIHHKTLIAKDFEGYQNLVRLVSDAHVNGVYYRPRCDMETLAKYSKGIIGLSGCVNGVASQYLIYNDYENARKATADFRDIFGKENYFIEIQNHGIGFQKRIIPGLMKLSKEFDLKVVCTNDVHYVHKSDSAPHDALLCIQTGKIVRDEQRMKYPCNEFYLKSREEMEGIFGDVAPDSFDNTVELAEMCDLEIKFGENHYPKYERPIEISYEKDQDHFERVLDRYVQEKNSVLVRDGKDPITLDEATKDEHRKNGLYLFDLCKKGLIERYNVNYDEVIGNFNAEEYPEDYGKGLPPKPEDPDYPIYLCTKLEYELSIITGAGFVDYFLITWDFINWSREQGIPVGPGRGSGAGSLIAYVLKITDIDPIRFGLLFERMLSLERVSPPDFDVDFCMRRRDLVVAYVRDKYGKDCVANIITFGTFGAKMIIRDLSRVHDIPYSEADRVAKMVPDELNISLDESLEKSKELQTEIRANPATKLVFDQGKVIEGMVRNTGKHACGIIVCDEPLTNLVPVTLQEGDLTVQYPKGPSEDLGLLKCDFLGLKTLTVISDAVDNIQDTTALKDFDIESVSLDDKPTYDLFNAGKTVAVFQLESGGMQNLCRRLGLSEFEEIIALIALYRPGPMQFIDQYIEGKKDPATVQIPHPKLKELVSETYGVLVYQEQVMQVAQIIAGYTLGGADILRRAMGKKKPEVMAAQRSIFVEGSNKTSGLSEKEASDLFALLEKFAQYGFNKSHSAAYAMLSYRTAYLKANYPVQFMAAVLTCELGNADKLSGFLEECQAMDIGVAGPDINRSRLNFTPVMDHDDTVSQKNAKGIILFGLGAIKGVGDVPSSMIIKERDENGPYKDFEDFAARIDPKQCNRRVVESLIKTGAFDKLKEDRASMLEDLDAVMKNVADLQKDKEKGQANMFDMFDTGDSSSELKNSVRRSRAKMPMREKLLFEKELLGFYVSGHPLDKFIGISEHLDSFQDTGFEKIPDRDPYRLCGVINTVEKKISKRDNRLWAILSISTKKANYQVMMFSDAYAEKMDAYTAEMEKYSRFKARQGNSDDSPKNETINMYEEKHMDDANMDSPQRTSNFTDSDPDEDMLEPIDPLAPGTLVMVEGQVSKRNDEVMLTANKLLPLENKIVSLVEEVTWVIEANGHSEDFIQRLKSKLLPNFGETEVRVGVQVDDEYMAIASIAGSLTWRVNGADFQELKKHPAVIDVQMKIPEPEAPAPRWAKFSKKSAG